MQTINSHNPTELFKQVLTGTARLSDEQQDSLQTLLFSFPQCNLLHAIQAQSGNAAHVGAAAAWFCDSATLQKVVQSPNSLPHVSSAQIIFKDAGVSAGLVNKVSEPVITLDEPFADPAVERVSASEPLNRPEQVYEPAVEDVTPVITPVEPVVEVTAAEPVDETQQLIIESIAANDYFVFDQAFIERNQTPDEPELLKQQAEPKPQPPVAQLVAEEGQVTRYHDDMMPYSFLWWLDKTRSKHSSMYRPFANTRIKPLEQQVTELPQELPDEKKKEEIVERFLQEEPSIKPPSSDKIDTENKAKQSAEDQEELITETLARIYADQMLYSKAIAAYKILMLRNPEKRRYFASQIEILEKKIN